LPIAIGFTETGLMRSGKISFQRKISFLREAFRARKISASRIGGFALIAATAGFLAACEDEHTASAMRAYHAIEPKTLALMQEKGTTQNAPVLIRTYKKEAELEIWKMAADGHYTHLKTYPMCRWSGQLGPKVKEGDRQVPEGFYAITPGQMNPNSAYYLSFNVGYPNALDRALGHTGGSIMVHGICSSAGCFSMTDPQIAEIYAIAREAFSGGQHAIQMQSYPFHMTAENMARYRADPNIAFWKQLKEGADNFEVSKQEVSVGVCNKHYVFNQTAANGMKLDAEAACPPLKHDEALQAQVEAKETLDEGRVAELISQGVQPIHTVYADGGQHPSFTQAGGAADASRPEALALGSVDLPIEDTKKAANKKQKPMSPAVQVAAAKADAAARMAAEAAATPPETVSSFTSMPEAAKSEVSKLTSVFSWKKEAPAAEAVASTTVSEPAPAAAPETEAVTTPTPPKRKVSIVEKPQVDKPQGEKPQTVKQPGEKLAETDKSAKPVKPAAKSDPGPVAVKTTTIPAAKDKAQSDLLAGSSAALPVGFSAVAKVDPH
jgi:murein L,D-transpeptidase YafK